MEAKYYGVPLLGVPMFADQPGNIKMAEEEGWALQLDFNTLTEEAVTEALEKLLGNSSYYSTVKKLSTVYRDRPMGPMKTAIYWIEYVIRHQGAPHLRSQAADQNWIQRSSLDVLVFLLGVLYGVYRVMERFYRCAQCVYRKFRKSKWDDLKKVS